MNITKLFKTHVRSHTEGMSKWHSLKANTLRLAVQLFPLMLISIVIYFFYLNTSRYLEIHNLNIGYDFLLHAGSFSLGNNYVGYEPGDSYLWAICAGVINTLRVSLISIVVATLVGTIVAIIRLSNNLLASGLARLYIEVLRNIPLLLQMFFWYTLLSTAAPLVNNAWALPLDIYISNRGINFPSIEFGTMAAELMCICLLLSLIITIITFRFYRYNFARGLGVLILSFLLTFMVGQVALFVRGLNPFTLSMPQFQGFGFNGGGVMSPEFGAVLLSLSLYTSAFVAEIVRSGFLAVDSGQTEAAEALGLTKWLQLRFILLPQALRTIIPPLASEHLSLVKNSSLAVAVGYTDLFRVSTVIVSETGSSLPMISVVMAIYLAISLVISAFMNLYNHSILGRGNG